MQQEQEGLEDGIIAEGMAYDLTQPALPALPAALVGELSRSTERL